MNTSVVAAFLGSGRRKAGTPFESASTPVRATAPEEKPFRSRNSERCPAVCWRFDTACSASKGTGFTPPNQPKYHLVRPRKSSAVTITMYA